MQRIEFKTSELEFILSRESKYIKELIEEFGKTDKYRNEIGRVIALCKRRNIDNEQIITFERNLNTGYLYIIFDKNEIKTLFNIYTELISGSFEYDKLKNQIIEIYKTTIKNNPQLSLLLELSIIKSFLLFFKEKSKNLKNEEKLFNNALNSLRDILIESRNIIHSYNIFNKDFQKEILDKAFISLFFSSKDNWDVYKKKIDSYYFPFNFFVDLVHFFNTLGSLEHEIEIINYFEDKTIWSIDDISSPPYKYYLPFLRDELKTIIIKKISKNSKQTLEYLLKEENDLNTQLNQIRNDIVEGLNEFNKNFKTEIGNSLQYPVDIMFLSRINSQILDFNRKVMGNILMANKILERMGLLKKKIIKNEQLRNISYTQLMELMQKQNIIENSEVFLSILTFNDYSKKYETLFEKNKKYVFKVAKQSFNKLKQQLKQDDSKELKDQVLLMKNIISSKHFSTQFNYDFVKTNYFEIMKSIENDITIKTLQNSIVIYNQEYKKEQYKQKRELFFIQNELLPKDRLLYIGKDNYKKYKQFIKENENVIDIGNIIKKHFSSVISSLIYDIRGSSFMSMKLRNAQKQAFIMRKFQNQIINTIKSNNGFPIKETGDGGIVVFFNKSKEIYRTLFKETVSTKNIHIRHSIATGSIIQIKESEKSSINALECALKMINSAEEFIKDNYMNYRDWFFDIHEKKLEHEGMEYTLLPPEFKALFRIGIGISSGKINRDVDMTINAYGDVDVYGVSVNDSQLLSESKNPEMSTIIVDHITFFNMILNKEFYIENFNVSPESFIESLLDNNININTTFENIGEFNVKYYGTFYIDEKDKNKKIKYDYIPENILIDENGNLYENDRIIKLLYKISEI